MTITYTDRTATADTMSEAKHAVREAAIRALASADAASAVVFVPADGEVYAYTSQAAADADQTGTLAFAVISRD